MPSDPVILKQIKDCLFEVSASMTRVEAEKDLIKEAIAELSESTDIPKKFLNKITRLFHKQNREEVGAEQDSTSELYDRIFQSAKEE